MDNQVILQISGVSKTFITTKALQNVSLEFYKGEVRGLVGENGSGKSTLSSIIAGLLFPDHGEMFLKGNKYSPRNLIEASRNKVNIIVQEMGTIDDLSIAANLFMGEEHRFISHGILKHHKMNREAATILQKYGITNIDPAIDIGKLSFEDRKMVELVRAFYNEPELLIVDETTTALSQNGREILYHEINKLKEQNKSVIFISHDLQEVLAFCDRITILKDGQVVDTASSQKINEDELKELMVGRELEHSYYRSDWEPTFTNEIVLTTKDLSLEGEFHNISLELHKGEILGFGGLTDCGMHALGKVLFGLLKPTKGEIKVFGKKIKNHIEAIASGVGYVPKNRDQEGLMLVSSILDNIVLPSLKDLENQKLFFISPSKEKIMANKGAQQLNIKMSSVIQYCIFLSGGNKQKVVLAKWIAKDSDLLILDCPTRGIDVNVKAAIYLLMQQLKERGKSIVMISEELQELIGMCDRIVILKKGEMRKTFNRSSSLKEEQIIHFII